MAWSIARALRSRPGALVVHWVGSFHVRNGRGLPEHLRGYRPGTRTVTVIIEPVDDVGVFAARGRGAGDFVILTKTSLRRQVAAPGS